MTTLKWSEVYYKQIDVTVSSDRVDTLRIGDQQVDTSQQLYFEGRHDEIEIMNLARSVYRTRGLTSDACHPQLAYHAFHATRRPSYMETYFPITKSLSKEARRQFHQTVGKVMRHTGFDVQLLDKRGKDNIVALPALGYLVAGHIVELFFFRPDILNQLLQAEIHISLYTDQTAFTFAGGVAGGCYNPERGCVQLVVSRLFEGFNQPTPGVFPFLHEFGHLLDFFDEGTGKHELTSSGWLLGMRSTDGEIYSPEAREAFIAGKRLEMERYDRQVANPDGVDPLPIGHPYVFQNNSEFIAGYLEMFFRNPHTFAAQNRDLFDGFARLFRQDPRQYRETDFPFYIEQNRTFYQSGQRPRAHGLKMETD